MDRSMDWFEEMLLGRIQRDYLTLNESWLVESQGLYDKTESIIEEIVALVKNERGVLLDRNLYLISLNNIELKGDSFLREITQIKIYIGESNEESHLSYINNQNNLNDKNELIGISFILYCEEDSNKRGYLDVENLKTLLSYELQHAYRYYMLLINNKYGSNEVISKDRLQYVVNNALIGSQDNEYSMYKKFIFSLYYISDIDEIKSKTSEAYQYILNNEYITKENINQYIKEIPSYKILNQLQIGLGCIKQAWKKYPQLFVDVMNELQLKQNPTPTDGKKFFERRIIYAISFAERKFYQLIGKALDEVSNGRLMKEGKIYNISCPKIYLTLDKYMSKYSKLWNR